MGLQQKETCMSLQTQTNPTKAAQTNNWGESQRAEEQTYRAGAYNLLANLLRATPEPSVLTQLSQLAAINREQDELALAMCMLGLAARDSTLDQLDDEYHALFIGLGRGELVPYGSWYLTGFLQEKPLALLRADLARLGFERQDATHEPEDHIAALCEVMAMLINDDTALDIQSRFFESHLGPWQSRFFTDLSQAKHAVFYRAVGRFGYAFMELEQSYLNMEA